jgi:hypothetical protein
MLEELKKFYRQNDGTYYMITNREDHITILRVDDVGFEALNTKEFIEKNIGDVVDFSYNGDDRFDFTIRSCPNVNYYLFNYDSGIVTI